MSSLYPPIVRGATVSANGAPGLVPMPLIADRLKFLRGDGSFQAISGGGDALTSASLAQFAATSSLELKGVISDETGAGALVFATSPTLVTPILGTPTSGTLTNCTGLPVSSGVSGLGTGVATFLATPSSANLASAVTNETGSGALVFGTAPTLTTPTFSGIVTSDGASVTSANALGALAIDVSKEFNTKSISTDSTFTFSGTPATNQWFSVYVTNSDTAAHTLTIPSSFSVTQGATVTTVSVPASADTYLIWRYDGSVYRLFGDAPASVSDTAYATSWDGVTAVSPSKNAVFDIFGSQVNYPITVYAAGTAYSFTASDAAIDFGTTDPNVTINKAGTYLVMGRVYCKYNAATYAATQTLTLKVRRTNNTAADVSNSSHTATLRVITTLTDSIGVMPLPPVIYTTTNTNDALALYGSLSATPAAGSVDATEASLVVIKLY